MSKYEQVEENLMNRGFNNLLLDIDNQLVGFSEEEYADYYSNCFIDDRYTSLFTENELSYNERLGFYKRICDNAVSTPSLQELAYILGISENDVIIDLKRSGLWSLWKNLNKVCVLKKARNAKIQSKENLEKRKEGYLRIIRNMHKVVSYRQIARMLNLPYDVVDRDFRDPSLSIVREKYIKKVEHLKKREIENEKKRQEDIKKMEKDIQKRMTRILEYRRIFINAEVRPTIKELSQYFSISEYQVKEDIRLLNLEEFLYILPTRTEVNRRKEERVCLYIKVLNIFPYPLSLEEISYNTGITIEQVQEDFKNSAEFRQVIKTKKKR